MLLKILKLFYSSILIEIKKFIDYVNECYANFRKCKICLMYFLFCKWEMECMQRIKNHGNCIRTIEHLNQKGGVCKF
jgi:hypothetical protein